MIYLWEIADDYPEEMIGAYDKKLSGDRFSLKKGKKLPTDFKTPVFKFSVNEAELKQFDDLANNAMVPLVSQKVQGILLEVCPDDIQLLDAIISTNGNNILDYKVIVAVREVIGINHDSSEYKLIPETKKIMKFTKLRYFEGCLGKYHIARDKEYHSNLLISQVVRDALIESGCHGLGLYLPEEMFF